MSKDDKPESDQNGNSHAEGYNGDAVACGIDDLHRGEVGFLGAIEAEERFSNQAEVCNSTTFPVTDTTESLM